MMQLNLCSDCCCFIELYYYFILLQLHALDQLHANGIEMYFYFIEFIFHHN